MVAFLQERGLTTSPLLMQERMRGPDFLKLTGSGSVYGFIHNRYAFLALPLSLLSVERVGIRGARLW